ncbi:hypothetical protein IWW55_000933 [Coemansia sp. RSA 2706]|nr:hypothetical protein IWW55_000933 [Coemansia sp. RSA 2706]
MPLPDWESEFASQTTTESGMPYLTFTGQLEQSPNDQSEYRLLRLPNNMTVVCISDKDAQKKRLV